MVSWVWLIAAVFIGYMCAPTGSVVGRQQAEIKMLRAVIKKLEEGLQK